MCSTDAATGGQTTFLTRGWIHTYKALLYTGSTLLRPNLLSAKSFINRKLLSCRVPQCHLLISETHIFHSSQKHLLQKKCEAQRVQTKSLLFQGKGKMGSFDHFSFCNKNKKTKKAYSRASLSCGTLRTKASGMGFSNKSRICFQSTC